MTDALTPTPSLFWSSDHVAEGTVLVLGRVPLDPLVATVTTKLLERRWTTATMGTDLLAGLDRRGNAWLQFGSLAECRVIAEELSRIHGPVTLITASCNGFSKPKIAVGRWTATDGILVETPLPRQTARGLRGELSSTFNEAYDAIADRVASLLRAGLLVDRSLADLPTLKPVVTLRPPMSA